MYGSRIPVLFSKMCQHNLFSVFLVLFLVSAFPSKTRAFRKINENGVETILALPKENVSIECRTDMPMAYCGFLHPSGQRYSFSGQSTSVGKCTIKIKATAKDEGEWRCHIGSQTVGKELMKIINLRVVSEIAAVQKNITVVHGKQVTLYCTTTKGFKPLSYCRFEPPNDLPFSIDSSVTALNPLGNKYYFPSNKSLDRGDCAVTIRKVNYEDVGAWTCGAGLDDGKEYIDVIQLDVDGLYTISTASATGIAFGTITIIGLLSVLGFFAWKKRRVLGIAQPEVAEEGRELEPLPSRPSSSRPSPSPSRTPRVTPQPTRSIPAVTVQSPSQASEHSTPLMQTEEE